METAANQSAFNRDQELRDFLLDRLQDVVQRFGDDSETARLYRDRLEELEQEHCEALSA